MTARSIYVGIDPGVHTGLAKWCSPERRFMLVTSTLIHEAMEVVLELHRAGTLHSVTFEDARQRSGYYGGMDAKQARYGAGVREGVGSVKRDCSIWQGWLEHHGIPFYSIPPRAGATKWPSSTFARLTGWTDRTNEHGRDAATLVIGK